MNERVWIKLIAVFVLSINILPASASSTPNEIEVYFSPQGGCTDAIVREIDQASKSVHLMVNAFDSAPIAQALERAVARGITVIIISDKHKAGHSEQRHLLKSLASAGIQIRVDGSHEIFHSKVIIVDGKIVCTGSFNFTKQSEEQNAENLLILRNTDVARKYEDNWTSHLAHSEAFTGKKSNEPPSGKDED